jgi:2-amino-4-hydroxy-6-hydroxymethyldihydropteridine diphosphokinase
MRVAIALGSNLGDRQAHLAFAIDRLKSILDDVAISAVRETEPVGVPDRQSPFLNAVVTGETVLSPRALLEELQAIEAARGRARPFPGAARTLDLDLILAGDIVLNDADLVVPHPRFRTRRFVLEPLAEIAPEMRDPVSEKRVDQLLGEI